MTETPTPDAAPEGQPADAAATRPARKSGGALGGKVLAELQEIAGGLGIAGAKKMRKGELIEAIKAARGETPAKAPQGAPQQAELLSDSPSSDVPPEAAGDAPDQPARSRRAESDDTAKSAGQKPAGQKKDGGRNDAQKQKGDGGRNDGGRNDGGRNDGGGKGGQGKDGQSKGNQDKAGQDKAGQDKAGQDKGGQSKGNQGQGNQDGSSDDEAGGRRRNRRGRNRGNRGPDGEPTYSDDDVLVPAAGILDILDNYAFVRTTGYLPSENDVYVSLSMVRKWGLRKGDAVTGQVRQPREGERKEKFNPMVRVDSVNGMALEEARSRPEFASLTPVFADERLRLEHDAADLATRAIDVVAPVGKGQRGLLIAGPESGVTSTLSSIAEAVTTNNPECHLMVVLVDERPEDVTELRRSVKGEVISSTFDRPAGDHTTVAELAIERAKRLVELGHDVVVLLDSLTGLGRAYNQAAPAAARVTPGGVDPAALQPAKSFFGAGRNVEDGGSLTILAAVGDETGARTDEAILEEFAGTATQVVRLRTDLARQGIVPAIDVLASSTRREDRLLTDAERTAVQAVRRDLAAKDAAQAATSLLDRLRSAGSNAEALGIRESDH